MTVSRCAAFFGSAALTVLLALSCVGWGCAASAGAVGSGKNGAISMEHKFERYVARMQRLLDRYGYAIVAGAVFGRQHRNSSIGTNCSDCGCCGG